MGRFRLSVAWRVAVAFGLIIPAAAIVVGGSGASAGAFSAPLSCHGGEPFYGTALPGQCFMGYVDMYQWNDSPIPIEGGKAPYTVSLVSGYLPTGIALEPNGHVEGYGLIPQDASFTILVTESSSPPQTLTTNVGLDSYEPPYSASTGKAGIPAVIEADDAVLPFTQQIGPLAVESHQSGGGGQTNPIVLELEQLVVGAVNNVECAVTTILEYIRPGPGCFK